jgi:hypothetical protein
LRPTPSCGSFRDPKIEPTLLGEGVGGKAPLDRQGGKIRIFPEFRGKWNLITDAKEHYLDEEERGKIAHK